MGDLMMSDKDCGWEIVEGFGSDQEYERFHGRIAEQVRAGLAEEERVKKPYSGIEWEEHWFRCLATRQTWRLVAPDPPFKGVFKPV